MYLRNNSELCHYGVKGMKWGVRRAAKKKAQNVRNPNYSETDRRRDYRVYGSKGKARINRDMNKGKSHQQAVEREVRRIKRKKAIANVAMAIAIDEFVFRGATRKAATAGAKYAARAAGQRLYNFAKNKNAQRAAREAIPKLYEGLIELKSWQYRVY